MCRPRLAAVLLVCCALAGVAAPVRQDQAPRRDRHGDPLPAGALARAGTTRWRHGGVLTLLAFLPDGKTVVSAGTDGQVCFWELSTGRVLRQVALTQPPPRDSGRPTRFGPQAVALSPDGKTLAWGAGSSIRLWDVTAGKERARTAETGVAVSLAFAPGGKLLASLEGDGRVRLWDLRGRAVLTWGGEARPQERQGGRGWGRPFFGPALLLFAPDGKTLLTAQSVAGTSPGGGGRGGRTRPIPTAQLWDVETGKLLRRLTAAGAGPSLSLPVFSPDGKMLAGVTRDTEGDSFVCLTEAAGGKELKRLKSGPLTALLFSPDGKQLHGWATTGRRLTAWDPAAGKEVRVIDLGGEADRFRGGRGGPGGPGGRGRGPILRARPALSPDGKLLAFPAAANAIGILDLAAGKPKPAPAGHDGPVTALAFSADGKSLVTWDAGASCRRWEVATGRASGTLPLPRQGPPVVAPDGRLLALLGLDSLRVLDTATGKERGRVPLNEADTYRVAFSPGGRRLAVLKVEDGGVKVYATDTLREVRALTPPPADVDADEAIPEGAPFFAPGGRYLATHTRDRGLAVWDVEAGRLLWQWALPSGGRVRGGTFTADGRTIVLDMGDSVLLLERSTGKERQRLGRPGSADAADGGRSGFRRGPYFRADRQALAVSPDGRTLAQVGPRGQLLLWDAYAGGAAVELAGHRGRVRSVAFSPDGKRLASGCDDTTALVWDVGPLAARLRPRGERLAGGEAEAAWDDLAGGDAGRAYASLCRLVGDPEQTVPLLARRLRPVPPADAAQVERWLHELDHRRFAVRRKARQELEKRGAAAVPGLKRLAAAGASAEARKAAQELLDLVASPTSAAENLRASRALEALERVATPAARKLLRELGGGDPGAFVTAEARAALARLSR